MFRYRSHKDQNSQFSRSMKKKSRENGFVIPKKKKTEIRYEKKEVKITCLHTSHNQEFCLFNKARIFFGI